MSNKRLFVLALSALSIGCLDSQVYTRQTAYRQTYHPQPVHQQITIHPELLDPSTSPHRQPPILTYRPELRAIRGQVFETKSRVSERRVYDPDYAGLRNPRTLQEYIDSTLMYVDPNNEKQMIDAAVIINRKKEQWWRAEKEARSAAMKRASEGRR